MWNDILSGPAKKTAQAAMNRVRQENVAGANICPPETQVFRALELVPPEKVKVCIVGQDPYHTPGQANGLAFSVNCGAPLQPSLKNIFKELESDLGCKSPINGDLTSWARQGVLLLNTVLSVYPHKANSCAEWGWQIFTHDIIRATLELPQPIVYLLWGASARQFVADLDFDTPKEKIALVSSHPSPFSAYKPAGRTPAFLGSKPFSKTNEFLARYGAEPIVWELD